MNEKIEVLHTAPLVTGGITSFVLNVASKINKKKFIISNVCFRDVHELSEDKLKSFGGKKYVVDLENIKSKSFKMLKKFFGIYKIIKKNNIKIFHIDTDSRDQLFLALAAKLAGAKKVIYHSHNTNSGRNSFIRKLFEILSTPLLYLVVDEYLACSEKAGEFLFNKKIINSSKYHVIKNGINVSDYIYNEDKRRLLREQMNLKDKFVIGHVGRFSTQKNHTFLIDIFNEVLNIKKNSILILIGIGELQDEIKNKVKSLGIEENVVFLNTRNDVNDLLQIMDVFLFPSLYEGLPVVGVEVQAAGLPCVFSDSITEEVKITHLVRFLSLNQSPKVWAENVISASKEKRINTYESINEAGYDIINSVKLLEKIYKR